MSRVKKVKIPKDSRKYVATGNGDVEEILRINNPQSAIDFFNRDPYKRIVKTESAGE